MEIRKHAKETACLIPLSTIYEEDGKVIARIEMPGIDKDDLSIRVEGEQLEIVGKRKAFEEKGQYLIRERCPGDFQKVFILDDTVDREKIEAAVENGILTLVLHLKESVKPRKIEIKTG